MTYSFQAAVWRNAGEQWGVRDRGGGGWHGYGHEEQQGRPHAAQRHPAQDPDVRQDEAAES